MNSSAVVLTAGKKLFRNNNARKLLNHRQMSMVALREEFASSFPTTPVDSGKASTASVSTLHNGVVVLTEDSMASSTVTVTYPDAGSSNEAVNEHGAALLHDCLSFRSGGGNSTIMKMRTIENEGGVLFSGSSRTSGTTLGYTTVASSAATHTNCLPMLLPTCSYERWDIRDAKELAQKKTKEAQTSAQVVLTEQLYSAAFGAQSSMGRSYFCDPSALSRDSIMAFGTRNFRLSGAVVTATGINDHDLFCTQVEEAFASFRDDEAAASSSTTASPYMGGEARLMAASSFTHLALAFDASGSSKAVQSVATHCLNILGGGCVKAFTAPEGDLLGVYAGAENAAGDALVDGLCSTMISSTTASLTPEIIARAKALAKADALFGYESGSDSKALAQQMTASFLEKLTFTGAEGIVSDYDSITDDDIQAAFRSLLKTKPSLAGAGNLSTVPYLGTIEPRFG